MGDRPWMRVTLHCKAGWQKDRAVFEQVKEELSRVGKLAESRPGNAAAGYLAERPDTLKGLIRVWSPCGCCWTYMSPAASVLTQCDSPEHDFNWPEAEAAIAALRAAEESQQTEGESVGEPEQPKLALVKLPKA
jgi:hypothetical protein